jgi:hypothetical protein
MNPLTQEEIAKVLQDRSGNPIRLDDPHVPKDHLEQLLNVGYKFLLVMTLARNPWVLRDPTIGAFDIHSPEMADELLREVVSLYEMNKGEK